MATRGRAKELCAIRRSWTCVMNSWSKSKGTWSCLDRAPGASFQFQTSSDSKHVQVFQAFRVNQQTRTTLYQNKTQGYVAQHHVRLRVRIHMCVIIHVVLCWLFVVIAFMEDCVFTCLFYMIFLLTCGAELVQFDLGWRFGIWWASDYPETWNILHHFHSQEWIQITSYHKEIDQGIYSYIYNYN